MKDKHILMATLAVAVMLTLGSSASYADHVIDKGDLGQYTRDGKFARRILSTRPNAVPSVAAMSAQDEMRPIVDKGGLGRYVRDGKFLRRVLTAKPKTSGRNHVFQQDVITMDHYKHQHRLAR